MRLSMERATRTSSVCRRGFLPRSSDTFIIWMGSIISCGISLTLWSMLAKCLVAFSSRAALGPRRELVLAVIIVPSANSIADELTPDCSC